jgi:release factor glutamine methyltransferase
MFSQEIAWLLEEKYHGEKTAGFYADLARLESGEPLAYIIGSIPFLNTIIYLDSKPLIPRVETEFWTEKVISEISSYQKNSLTEKIKVLDLCAGSGCIGIAIGKALPNIQVDFVELNPEHLPTIKRNCQQNNLTKDSYRIFEGNLFTLKDDAKIGQYDFIISNPPYIDSSLNRTEASVKNFEPAIALYADEKGLKIINDIILSAPKYLIKGGQLWFEHEPEHSAKIQTISKNDFLATTHFDQYQVERFTKLVLQ